MSLKVLAVALVLATASATQHEGGYDGAWGSSAAWPASSSTSAVATATAQALTATMAPGELMVQIVSVGDNNGTLKYFPEDIQAPVGSVVQFQFHPKVCFITGPLWLV